MADRSQRRGMTAGFLAVLGRPDLWMIALRQGWRLVPTRWWARRPHLPVPDRAYLRFRLVTQYGDPDRRPDADDLVRYLEWCRHER